MRKGTLAAVSEMKKESPVAASVPGNKWQRARTGGRMRSSITFQLTEDDMVGLVGPSVEYARYVVEGTGPHIIRPAGKKALYWSGVAHPSRFVRHPGTAPNDFVGRAKDTVENEHLPAIAAQELEKMKLAVMLAGG